jgi:hypothetical protein
MIFILLYAINMSQRIYNIWKQDDMDEALSKLRNGVIGFNEAHRQNKIPKPTLRRHLRGLNQNVKFGRTKDMTENMKKELVTSTPYKEEIGNTENQRKRAVKRKIQTMEVKKKKGKQVKAIGFVIFVQKTAKKT